MSDANGTWNTVTNTPMGQQKGTLTLVVEGGKVTGTMAGAQGSLPVDGTESNGTLTWKADVTTPMPLSLEFVVSVDGDDMTGTVKSNFGNFPLKGARA